MALTAIGGAIALTSLTLHPDSIAVVLAILTVATALIYASLPIFRAIPTAQLPTWQRAGFGRADCYLDTFLEDACIARPRRAALARSASKWAIRRARAR